MHADIIPCKFIELFPYYSFTEPVVQTNAPPPPQELHATPINNSVVRLTWKRPKFTPGISFYTIRYRTVQMDNIKPEPNATYIKHVVTNDKYVYLLGYC